MKKIFLLIISAIFLFGCANSSVQKEFTLDGDHGKLSVILEVPKKEKEYPLVMILHGFNASKDMPLLTDLANKLQNEGIATIRFDFNGHGQSEGSFLDMTALNEIEDTKKVYEYISKLPQVKSVSLAGHSLGGVVAAMFAGELGTDKIKTVVLMAPAGELKDDTLKGDLFGIKYDPQNIPEYIVLSNGLKVGKPFLQTSQTLPIYETTEKYEGPVLIVHSKDDQLVPYSYGVQFKEIYKNAELETLSGFDHNFTQNTSYVNDIIADYFKKILIKE
ncbi:MAG: alpha/beta fold hydrolase [Elusimicrobia bacterium]|nr:alpha/beta fold hydrolase [Elusimicrobiota bacterium]